MEIKFEGKAPFSGEMQPKEIVTNVRELWNAVQNIVLYLNEGVDLVQLKVRYTEPTRPREGMVVHADGTSWNPGGGKGFYGYTSGAWAKLN